ncbi:MAG TPA: trypsin-like peptidase domain-containing protein [Rhodothermales bacterium]|nr:trypsin-like peptidase domain-containing protein [Rhodothermales bacterium]
MPSSSRRLTRSRSWLRRHWVLLGIFALTAGVALGVLATQLFRDEVGIVDMGRRDDPGAPTPAPATAEPIDLGDPDPPEPLAIPEAISLNGVFTRVAARVTPSVVFIRAELDSTVPDDGFHQGGGSVRETQVGSGIIVSEQGYVLTNRHVVDGAVRIGVLLNDRREYDAELVGSDPTTDLAVIRLVDNAEAGDETPLPVAALGDSDELEVGEWVVAVGNPFRLTSTVTTGIVSALGRQVNLIDDSFRIEDFIQTDAAINFGNSGGALVNLRGEVIGVVTGIATESGMNEGYGFAVPVNLARRVAADLIERGEVQRGYLGVEIRPVTAADARERGMPQIEGVLIVSVAEGGPASRAGLRPGDVLLRVDDEPVNAPNQFQGRVALRRPGEPVALDVFRNGQEARLRASLIGSGDATFRRWIAELGDPAEDPQPPAPGPSAPPPAEATTDWGIRLRDLTRQERRIFEVSSGAFVESVQSQSAAEVDGLPAGTVILAVESQPVRTAEEARVLLDERARVGGPALLRVRRPDGRIAFYDLASPVVE